MLDSMKVFEGVTGTLLKAVANILGWGY